jgi:hypothetical protein
MLNCGSGVSEPIFHWLRQSQMMIWFFYCHRWGNKLWDPECKFITHWMWREWSAHWKKSLLMYSGTNTEKQYTNIFVQPTVNTTVVTHNTTVSINTNALTIFVPCAFYLISWCCCSKQKSTWELETSRHAKTYHCTSTDYDVTNTAFKYVLSSRRKWRIYLLLASTDDSCICRRGSIKLDSSGY